MAFQELVNAKPLRVGRLVARDKTVISSNKRLPLIYPRLVTFSGGMEASDLYSYTDLTAVDWRVKYGQLGQLVFQPGVITRYVLGNKAFQVVGGLPAINHPKAAGRPWPLTRAPPTTVLRWTLYDGGFSDTPTTLNAGAATNWMTTGSYALSKSYGFPAYMTDTSVRDDTTVHISGIQSELPTGMSISTSAGTVTLPEGIWLHEFQLESSDGSTTIVSTSEAIRIQLSASTEATPATGYLAAEDLAFSSTSFTSSPFSFITPVISSLAGYTTTTFKPYITCSYLRDVTTYGLTWSITKLCSIPDTKVDTTPCET